MPQFVIPSARSFAQQSEEYLGTHSKMHLFLAISTFYIHFFAGIPNPNRRFARSGMTNMNGFLFKTECTSKLRYR
jgi:hypothetical protein